MNKILVSLLLLCVSKNILSMAANPTAINREDIELHTNLRRYAAWHPTTPSITTIIAAYSRMDGRYLGQAEIPDELRCAVDITVAQDAPYESVVKSLLGEVVNDVKKDPRAQCSKISGRIKTEHADFHRELGADVWETNIPGYSMFSYTIADDKRSTTECLDGARTVITAYPRFTDTHLGQIEIEGPCTVVRLFVERAARHKGVATFLLRQAVAYARISGCQEIAGSIPLASKPQYESWGAQVEQCEFDSCIAKYKSQQNSMQNNDAKF